MAQDARSADCFTAKHSPNDLLTMCKSLKLSNRTTPCGIASVVLAIASLLWQAPVFSASVTVVGTPHLKQLDPESRPTQRELVIDALASYDPSVICIEAMPGARVEEFLSDPGRHAPILKSFAPVAVQLGPEQQVRSGLDRAAARAAAAELEQKDSELTSEERMRLIRLQLAAFEPWSALLNWSALDDTQRSASSQRIGSLAAELLDDLLGSSNEIVTLAIPLARQAGHRRLCAVDSFVDEMAVQGLAEALMPLMQDPQVQAGIKSFSEESAERWKSDRESGLLNLMIWMNSPAYAELDRRTQWEVFNGQTHDAGTRRLMSWHARNSEILTWLFRALGEPDGERALLLIGAAHRPFIERALEAHAWIDSVSAHSVLTNKASSH